MIIIMTSRRQIILRLGIGDDTALQIEFAALPPASPGHRALLLCLTRLEEKDAAVEQAVTRIEQLESARTRPAPTGPPPKKR